ncbi:predicted protein [Arabidopsis lyrata subsp. lyrata]|uniref:Predicted protein n=1 Tax=Arabidopsis lyrata subsp. lyrata TaxID=81972 RepID=D7LZB0_ARALL|nr:predicted protein [Arabidopsis lyrata subsp. lyrata]
MVVTVAWCSCCGGVRLLAGGAVRGWFLRWLLARSSSPLCCSRLLCDSSLTVRCGSSRVCGGLDLLRCGFGLFRLIPVRFSSACGPPVLFASVGVGFWLWCCIVLSSFGCGLIYLVVRAGKALWLNRGGGFV